MNKSALALIAGLALQPALLSAADREHTIKEIRFAKGIASTTIKGRITGFHYVDYRLRATAGQTLKASLKSSNGANYFNILPPGSDDAAMFNGAMAGNAFEGLLPDDGAYTLRVYLVRAAARRNESSDFSLSVSVAGKPLSQVPPKQDALVPGTRYHAVSTVPCEPHYSRAKECRAGVIRRGFDGTATMELRWDKSGRRRILFVKGKPEASDTNQPLTYSRDKRGDFVILFGGEERFVIPEALVFGG